MAKKKVAGISTTTLVLGGVAVLAVGYLLTRPKPAPTVVYNQPGATSGGGSNATTVAAIAAGASVLSTFIDNYF